MITQDRLKELFSYDPETGLFHRIKGVKKAAAGSLAGGLMLNGYISIGVDLKRYYAHRLAWLYVYGYMPKQIDHKDMNRSNNRLANLRSACNSSNGANKPKPEKSKQNYKGVRMLKSGRYAARIKANKKEIHIGVYASEHDAALAYNKKSIELFGEYAQVNDVRA